VGELSVKRLCLTLAAERASPRLTVQPKVLPEMSSRRKARSTAASRPRTSTSMRSITYHNVPAPWPIPSRQRAANWRRVLQERVGVTQSQPVAFKADDWFDGKYNTSGFAGFFLHSVTVWSSPQSPSLEDSLLVVPSSPDGITTLGWSAQGYSGQVNRSVGVKVLYPPHLSGPFGKGNTLFTVTCSAAFVIVEIDATFA